MEVEMSEKNEYGAQITNVRRFDPEHDVAYYQGERLTDELALQISDRLDHEANPAMFPGLRPGGKSLTGGKRHSPSIQVVLPADVHAEVTRRAEAAHMGVSKWARQVIERELANA